MFEIATVKEEMSHSFNSWLADKAKYSIRIAQSHGMAHKSNLNVQSTKSGKWSARDQK